MSTRQEPSIRAYVRLIRAAEALHAEVSRGLASADLTASQFSAMKALRQNGKLAQRDIAKWILKSGGNITMLVDHLEEVGLAVRERDTVDRRVVYVSLTRAGEDLFDRIYPEHLERIRKAMSALDGDDCVALAELLERVSPTDLETVCAPPERAPVSR